ncbi:MAG: hypothetical protein RIF36_21800 [Imperialibacter sp.]|uniref:hypothetical protein n=1 Tax=Imperialibacter sp. TaxID=2038411 RepID=UPI0032EADE65
MWLLETIKQFAPGKEYQTLALYLRLSRTYSKRDQTASSLAGKKSSPFSFRTDWYKEANEALIHITAGNTPTMKQIFASAASLAIANRAVQACGFFIEACSFLVHTAWLHQFPEGGNLTGTRRRVAPAAAA